MAAPPCSGLVRKPGNRAATSKLSSHAATSEDVMINEMPALCHRPPNRYRPK